MSFILDLFLIFIFLVCVYTGFKRGFIRSIMSVVVVVIAILGSIKLTP
ncbi:MAG: CvpA family protein, partial [Clostridia bacterium]|nr:CvpA family protein [Clostridia bacterium]